MGSIEGDVDSWPGGYPYVFQGTVAEDATGGTHICTLTVVPGAGNELQVLYGQITVGNTTTAQVVTVFITDGTNTLSELITQVSGATANLRWNFPTTAAAANSQLNATVNGIVSGTMRVILSVGTAAVSVTQTFAVVLRVRADAPTFTLADSVGTPTLTTNTSSFF